jgi:hypothetical protein
VTVKSSLRKLVRLAEVAHDLHNSDLLLFRRKGLIAAAGRGVHSHAGKVVWWGDTPYCVEVREWFGGRAVTLASQVERYPGRIDVFRANPGRRWPEYDAEAAARYSRLLAGCDYGYLAVLEAALLHLPFVRVFVTAQVEDDAAVRRPPFCSQACAMADRLAGGVDPAPYLADQLTEPADLARSPFYQYQFTLADL